MGVDETSLDRIRNATFPTVRRGFDKHEVEKFLGRLADWLETGAGDESRSDVVKRELEKVGERTGTILAQAEESAQQIRAEAEEESRGTVNMANMEAAETRTGAEQYDSETRASADAYARETRDDAEQDAREAIEAAQAQARRIVAEAEQRREDTEALIGDLLRRRDDVMADTEELSRKLSTAVEQHRSRFELPAGPEPAAGDAEPESERPVLEMAESAETDVVDTEVADTRVAAEPEDAEEPQETMEPRDAEARDTDEPPDTEEHTITAEREPGPEPRPEHQRT
jgi:DivIVA domain-containing protein